MEPDDLTALPPDGLLVGLRRLRLPGQPILQTGRPSCPAGRVPCADRRVPRAATRWCSSAPPGPCADGRPPSTATRPRGGLPSSPQRPPAASSGWCRAHTSANPHGRGNPPPPVAALRNALPPPLPASAPARTASRQARGSRTGMASTCGQGQSSPSASFRSALQYSSRTTMRSTLAHGKARYQTPCRHST